MSNLTRRERNKLKSLADKLYKKGVTDEHAAEAFYRRMGKELKEAGLYFEGDALIIIAESEKIHKEALNEIILDIREKIIVSQFKGRTVLNGTDAFTRWQLRTGRTVTDPEGRVIKDY